MESKAKSSFAFVSLNLCIIAVMYILPSQVSGQMNPDSCNLSAETGPCYAYLERFHYNMETDECKMFVYGGCGSNENNFETEEECMKFKSFCLQAVAKKG